MAIITKEAVRGDNSIENTLDLRTYFSVGEVSFLNYQWKRSDRF